ncbi:MAG TPA: SDR family oxidoreductase [Vicinamibacterales bacterium]|jgi:NAD(P)-dependent dehydrogenase (short-subunit alcohol dehydrogenase family)|nr:SDR family oxidoreductase [Vicinamibacterales bacterium]
MLRVALVTGANRGIGLEVARQLAAASMRVVVSARDGVKAETAATALAVDGLDVSAVQLDVTNPASIAAAAGEILSRFGHVDVLVNNAAVLLAERDGLLDTSADDFRLTFETNVLGPIAVAQAFVPGMIERKYGRVVNVSSRAGQLSGMGTYAPAYAISKTALNGVTRSLAAATKGTGVLVNSACPGWVRTDMGGKGAPRSVEQGADTIVWLAMLPDGGPTGGFFADRKSIEW